MSPLDNVTVLMAFLGIGGIIVAFGLGYFVGLNEGHRDIVSWWEKLNGRESSNGIDTRAQAQDR